MCRHLRETFNGREVKTLTQEQIDLLNKPLPEEAIAPHPTKTFLSTINSIYVTERLNQVFGVGVWQIRTDVVDNQGKMVVCKTTFEVPDYGIHYECFGGNDNADLGDAYKGAVTDALTKIGSWMGIGAAVWKDKKQKQQPTKAAAQPQAKQQSLRERIIAYIGKMDDQTRNDYLTYFQITDINSITDAKAQEIAEFEKKKKKQ
jgi:hypothetical protein